MQHSWERLETRGCIQKFPDWPPGATAANGIALCHWMQLYRYFVSQSSEFCRHSPLCCFSMSNTKGKRRFRYRHSPETFGYTLIYIYIHTHTQTHTHTQLWPGNLNRRDYIEDICLDGRMILEWMLQ